MEAHSSLSSTNSNFLMEAHSSLSSTNSNFLMEAHRVLCAVQTETLYLMYADLSLQWLNLLAPQLFF